MNKTHTPFSLLLAALGMVALLAEIFLPRFLPGASSPIFRGIYLILPGGLIYWSLKNMKSAESAKNGKVLRTAAAYMRLAAGLLILAALGVFGSGWKIGSPNSSLGTAFLILIFIVSLGALVLTLLNFTRSSSEKP